MAYTATRVSLFQKNEAELISEIQYVDMGGPVHKHWITHDGFNPTNLFVPYRLSPPSKLSWLLQKHAQKNPTNLPPPSDFLNKLDTSELPDQSKYRHFAINCKYEASFKFHKSCYGESTFLSGMFSSVGEKNLRVFLKNTQSECLVYQENILPGVVQFVVKHSSAIRGGEIITFIFEWSDVLFTKTKSGFFNHFTSRWYPPMPIDVVPLRFGFTNSAPVSYVTFSHLNSSVIFKTLNRIFLKGSVGIQWKGFDTINKKSVENKKLSESVLVDVPQHRDDKIYHSFHLPQTQPGQQLVAQIYYTVRRQIRLWLSLGAGLGFASLVFVLLVLFFDLRIGTDSADTVSILGTVLFGVVALLLTIRSWFFSKEISLLGLRNVNNLYVGLSIVLGVSTAVAIFSVLYDFSIHKYIVGLGEQIPKIIDYLKSR